MSYSRTEIADAIVARFDDETIAACAANFAADPRIGWFAVDDLLPEEMARKIRASFPPPSSMKRRSSLRERKQVAAQMDRYDPLGEEALFAFQDPRLVKLVGDITGFTPLNADPELYAGGLSLMLDGDFLNPHLDNSHNHDRSQYRVLNLLYYCSPDWSAERGGSLELWPEGPKEHSIELPSLFNRFVVMSTGHGSWHSVSKVNSDTPRCCVSNYYFSTEPLGGKDYFRVTTFRGRPEQPVRDTVLRVDAAVRQSLRKVKPAGFVQSDHIYKQPSDE